MNRSWPETGSAAVIVLEGGTGPSPLERWLGDVRRAIVLDLVMEGALGQALAQGLISPLIVGTDDASLAEELRERAGALGERGGRQLVVVETGGQDPFHWGRTLHRIVRDWSLERVIVMGGASAPLLQLRDVEAMVRRLSRGRPGVWANNVYSADIIAFTPARSLDRIDPPATDNALPLSLHYDGGLPLGRLPRTLGLTFDVDTPTDALILALHPGAGPRVRRMLAGAPELEPLRRAGVVLYDEGQAAWIAGRISGHQLRFLDHHTRCRLRVFSELRGMKSLGLDARGEATSLLAAWLEEVGPEAFIQKLAACCGAAFMDTRPLMAHRGRSVPAADRFASDLGRWDMISDPWLRRFTAAARQAPIPVILGGHSLVTGGLRALLEACRPPGGVAFHPP